MSEVPTLKETVAAVMRRKKALLGLPDEVNCHTGHADDEQYVLLFSGFELDFAEMKWLAERVADMCVDSIAEGSSDPTYAVMSVWSDGLITGLMHERACERAMKVKS